MADYQNPADSAMPYLNQVPGTVTPYYNPYINAGQDSLSQLMSQYQTLLTDPNAVMQMAGSGYQQSPGYQYEYDSAMNAENSAAAAGGMLGTPYHQENAANAAADVANQDYQQYLDQALKLYGVGLHGTEGINQMGYQASDALAQALANNLNTEATLEYAGTEGENEWNQNEEAMNDDFWDALIGGIGTGIGTLI
jgi:hypothetical protein